MNEEVSEPNAVAGAQSEEDLMQQKFRYLRLRHRNRPGKRAALRPSTSHEEVDASDDATPVTRTFDSRPSFDPGEDNLAEHRRSNARPSI